MGLLKTIFIVDDDEDDRLLMREAVRNFIDDVSIVEVPGGVEMSELLDEDHAPDNGCLILIDMNMPRMNGLELLTVLKKDTRWRAVPVIMLSTTSNPLLINKAYDLGVNAFMIKPVIIGEFEWMAQMINLCFINNNVLGELPRPQKKPAWRNVLVVEDSDDHWELMKLSLKRTMPSVRLERISGKQMMTDVLEKYRRDPHKQPEMILLDLYLPDRLDGLFLLNQIRRFIADNSLPNVPIIVFSYSSHPEDVNAALSEKANAYLVKPPDVTLWPEYLQNLCDVWSNAATLPKAV